MPAVFVIMRSDMSGCLYEGESLIVGPDKKYLEKFAKPYCGKVVEFEEAKRILELKAQRG